MKKRKCSYKLLAEHYEICPPSPDVHRDTEGQVQVNEKYIPIYKNSKQLSSFCRQAEKKLLARLWTTKYELRIK